MPTKVPPNAKPKANIEKRASAERFPTTRIDEDFVARALAGLPDDPATVRPAVEPSGSDGAAPQRGTVTPLPGMMSLGAGLGAIAR